MMKKDEGDYVRGDVGDVVEMIGGGEMVEMWW